METVNMSEGKGRGMFLFIHHLFAFQVHQFDVELNEALFCILVLKRKDTLLLGSFYRSLNSTTENNDNLKKLLDTITEKCFSHVLLFLEISTTRRLISK